MTNDLSGHPAASQLGAIAGADPATSVTQEETARPRLHAVSKEPELEAPMTSYAIRPQPRHLRRDRKRDAAWLAGALAPGQQEPVAVARSPEWRAEMDALVAGGMTWPQAWDEMRKREAVAS